MSVNHMSEFDQNCADLTLVHGELLAMECLHPWSDERYENTTSPWDLSGMYKLTFADGAEVTVGTLYSYAVTQGSFWYFSDSTKTVNSVFAREDRALAYFALRADVLTKDREGECALPSQAEADRILADLDVPFEALKYGCKTAAENANALAKKWLKKGLVKKAEDGRGLTMKVRKSMPTEKSPLLYVNALDGKEYLAGRYWFGEKNGYLVVGEGDMLDGLRGPDSIEKAKDPSFRAQHFKVVEISGKAYTVIKMNRRALRGLVRSRSATELYCGLAQVISKQNIYAYFNTVWFKVERYTKIKEKRKARAKK